MIRPTGKYRGCKNWENVIAAAKLRPRLKRIVENYEITKHPGCLNSIMDNADSNLWITYHTGRITNP